MKPCPFIWGGLIAAALVATPGCDESLPPRVDPPRVLVASQALVGTTVVVDAGDVTSGGAVQVSMTSTYSEVLSESAAVHASMIVSLQEYPSCTRLLTLGVDDVATPGVIDGRIATIGVNKSVTLLCTWDHRTDTTGFWAAGMTYHRIVTGRGEVYYQSDTVHLVVEGNLQIFKRVPAVQLPRRVYAVVYQLWSMLPPPPPLIAYGPSALRLRNTQSSTGR